MASRRNQILAVSAVWVAVCGLGWHAYSNVLPKYGLIRRSAPARNNAQDWQQLQKEQDEFYKQGVPWWTRISVSRVEPGRRTNIGGGPRELNGCYLYFATNQTISQVYSALTGVERWQISEFPKTDERYDVRIRAPLSEKKNIPKAFLNELDLAVMKMASVLSGYRYTGGTPPPNPAPPNSPGVRRGGNIGQMTLASARGMIANRVNAPVEIDSAVRGRKPGGDGNLQVNWALPPEKFADQIASIYGVAVQKSSVETTSVLLYQPKKTSSEDLKRWAQDGKL